jgi:hypothetical protein
MLTPMTPWRHAVRTAGRAIFSTALLASGLFIALAAGSDAVAGATVTTFTWTGAGTPLEGAYDWSDANNWAGGIAPAQNSTIDVAFGPLPCNSSCGTWSAPNYAYSNNDISGLTIDKMSIDATQPTCLSPSPEDQVLWFEGLPVTLDTLQAKQLGPNCGPDVPFDLPVTLGANATWTFSGGLYDFHSTVSGSHTLKLSLIGVQSGGPMVTAVNEMPGATVGVGTVTIAGTNEYRTLATYFRIWPGATINAAGANVAVTDMIFDSSGTVGPIAVSGGSPVATEAPYNGPYGIFGIEGAKSSLSYNTVFSFQNLTPGSGPTPQAGVDYPTITSSGSVSLGSAYANLYAACGQPIGTTYTLVSASGGITGTLRTYDNATGKLHSLKNGLILQAHSTNVGCSPGQTPPYLQFFFNHNTEGSTLTATVVGGP